MKLSVLRAVDWEQLPKTALLKDGRYMAPTHLYCEEHEYRRPYFSRGFVNNDLPRAVAYTEDLMQITPETGGFTLGDENGFPVADAIFDTVEQAENARASARVSFGVSIDVPETEAADRMAHARAAKAAKKAETAVA